MSMIPEFQTLPLHICLKIFKMVPRPAYVGQLINMRECLEDYQAGGIWTNGARWQRWSYMRFALFKAGQKRELNRER